METNKKAIINLRDGQTKEFTVETISYPDRNDLFTEYLDISKFQEAKGNTDDVLKFIKQDKSVFKFIEQVLKYGIPNLDMKLIISNEGDRLFQEYGEFILGGNSKN